MHVTTKEVDQNGTHILTSVVEGDGPNPIASANAKLNAKVISLQRTESGGVQVQTALTIDEPTSAPVVTLAPADEAVAYLVAKGIAEAEAKEDVATFGVDRVLAARAKDAAEAQAKLDEQLADKLAGR